MTMDGDGSYFRENSLTELHFFYKRMVILSDFRENENL